MSRPPSARCSVAPWRRHSFRPRRVPRSSRRAGPASSPMRCSGCMTASPAAGSSKKKESSSVAAPLRPPMPFPDGAEHGRECRWSGGLRLLCAISRPSYSGENLGRLGGRPCQIALDHAGDIRPLAEIVMLIARHDGEPGRGILRRTLPTRVLHAAAEQGEELRDVFRRDGVVVGEQQQRRHRQLGDFCAPVVVLPHQLPMRSSSSGNCSGWGATLT